MGTTAETIPQSFCANVSTTRICLHGTSGEPRFWEVKVAVLTQLSCLLSISLDLASSAILFNQPRCSSCVLRTSCDVHCVSYRIFRKKTEGFINPIVDIWVFCFQRYISHHPSTSSAKSISELATLATYHHWLLSCYGSTTFGLRIEVRNSHVYGLSWISQWPTYLLILLSLQ